MSVHLNVVLSDHLNREIDRVVQESESSKSEVFRKALQLFLAARDGSRDGLKIGFFDADTQKMETEIVGL